MMLSLEGMDMHMGTPSCVWSIPDPIPENLAQWEVAAAVVEVEVVVVEDQEEGLDPQLEDQNSVS